MAKAKQVSQPQPLASMVLSSKHSGVGPCNSGLKVVFEQERKDKLLVTALNLVTGECSQVAFEH